MERSIIFSAPMVRALLEGRKTQTRRLIDCGHPNRTEFVKISQDGKRAVFNDALGVVTYTINLKYQVGARLWVRETWQAFCMYDGASVSEIPAFSDIQYPATYDGWVSKLRPSIHMPRWASRLTLVVDGIKVERVQDICHQDATSEGVDASGPVAIVAFKVLWDSIHGRDSWAANPWVSAISFSVHKCNIDSL